MWESRPQSHWTARLNYWVTDTSSWLSETMQRKESRSYHVCSSSPTSAWEPFLVQGPRLLMEGGTVLEAWACVPLSFSWELKPPFYFLQTLSMYFLNSALVGKEGQDFGQQHLHFTQQERKTLTAWKNFEIYRLGKPLSVHSWLTYFNFHCSFFLKKETFHTRLFN